MKINVLKKHNEIIDDCYLEVSTIRNNKIIKDNYYGFTEKEVKKNFKKDFKYKFKNNKRFRDSLKKKNRHLMPNTIVLGAISYDCFSRR